MISVDSLDFGYGKKPLFDGLSLRLDPGRAYGLLGLNGAGKTSLLKLMAGALFPSSGEIDAFGRRPARREAAFLADTVFVAEDPWVPTVKAGAYLSRYAVFRPAFDRRRFDELRRDFAIEEDKALAKLSYGQRKKFALAAAFASGARTLLLDEPTNGLDIPSKMQLRRALAEAVSEERIIVVSTHQVRDLENIIDPVLILDSGRLAFELEAGDIAARLRSARAASLDGLAVVHAERDALGWSALVAAGEGTSSGSTDTRAADLELVFNAALAEPARLSAAIKGEALAPYSPGAALPAHGGTVRGEAAAKEVK
jgi:ABC-2 type transport system ATP-binding protein